MCTWIIDADLIQTFDNTSNILLRNQAVDSFLYGEKKLGIMSPKGFGKTFLLKSKRKLSQDAGVNCLPKDAMCDILETVGLSASLSAYMEDYSNWVNLWKYAIAISVLKNLAENEEEKQLLEPAKDDELANEIFSQSYLRTPCQIMNKCLTADKKDVNIGLNNVSTYISRLSVFHTPVHIFIDKIDQALKDNIHMIIGATKMSRGACNRSFWAYGQVALMEAAYGIFVQNSHIKVYFGIRSEALIGAESYTDLFLQLKSYIVELQYSDEDLRDMFAKYVANEKDEWLQVPSVKTSNANKAFFGVEEIPHGYVKRKEDPFRYLLRHTLKRPRDIMDICYNICTQKVSIKAIRHFVNMESSQILRAYIREMGPFIFDKDGELWEQLWVRLNRNVFRYKYTESLCKELNKTQNRECKEQCYNCENFKPFSLLYNAGLLGVIQKNNVKSDESMIKMQSAGHAIINLDKELLPDSILYFLHPMLANKVEMERNNIGLPYEVCSELIVGDGYPITKEQIIKIRNSDARKYPKIVFVSSPCIGMEEIRKTISEVLVNKGMSPMLSEATDFGAPENDIHSYDYCLNKVKECDALIAIVGERYGGVYSTAPQYKDRIYYQDAVELKELIKKTTGKSFDPSISLMEVYIARKRRIPTYVLVDIKVYDERKTYLANNSSEEFRPAFARDNKVFDMISYITRQQTGNWFKTYTDLRDAKEILNIWFAERTYSKDKR